MEGGDTRLEFGLVGVEWMVGYWLSKNGWRSLTGWAFACCGRRGGTDVRAPTRAQWAPVFVADYGILFSYGLQRGQRSALRPDQSMGSRGTDFPEGV
jgi:hypothetical protein